MNNSKVGDKASTDKYQDWMPRIIKPSLEEILGKQVLEQLREKVALDTNTQKAPGEQKIEGMPGIHSIQVSLVEMFGCQAGSGLTIQIGRACFQNLLRQHAADLGFTNTPFKMLPLGRKIDQGCAILADFFSDVTDQDITWEKSEIRYTWQLRSRKNDDPSIPTSNPTCMLVTGMLQEAFYWMSAGRTYIFTEKCSHQPDDFACTIQIERNPLD